MISKNELKYIRSLHLKKFRDSEKKFIAEGVNNVEEGLKSSFKCFQLIYTDKFQHENKDLIKSADKRKIYNNCAGDNDFARMSDAVNPQGVLAVFEIPADRIPDFSRISEPVIYLDNISDPGNVGTIIRTCDWFGFKNILISGNSADIYNSKTVRASAGSLFHVNIFRERDLEEYYPALQNCGYEIFASDMEGENIYNFIFPEKCVVIFSNEANGISGNVIRIIDDKIKIPSFGSAESLNVSSAAAIILSEMRKKSAEV